MQNGPPPFLSPVLFFYLQISPITKINPAFYSEGTELWRFEKD
jgi:hypothetical protein